MNSESGEGANAVIAKMPSDARTHTWCRESDMHGTSMARGATSAAVTVACDTLVD